MPGPTDEGRLAYSVAEAAAKIGVSRAGLYNLLKDGTVPSIKLGGRRLIAHAALENILGGAK